MKEKGIPLVGLNYPHLLKVGAKKNEVIMNMNVPHKQWSNLLDQPKLDKKNVPF